MAESLSELLARLLDRRYEDAAKQTVRSAASAFDTARVRAALAEFEAEVERLRRLNLPLQPDNPILRNLTAEIDAAARVAANRIADGSASVSSAALAAAETLQTALPAALGISGSVLTAWNVVSAEALAQLVAFQNAPAWAARLAQFAGAPTAFINQLILRDFAAGRNPLRTAADVARLVDALPRSQANILLRTLFLQTYKHATAAAQAANRDIIRRARRMATLDNRVCPVCVALHGTEIPVGEPVEMHEQCRCISVTDVIGGSLAFGPTGEEWLRGLDEQWQRHVLGPGYWEAWQAGAVQLGDVVGRYRDDLYGVMLTQRSLTEILGPAEAQRFHAEARRWYGEIRDPRGFPQP
ncbi:MAG: hypothetical protein IPM16_06810 [Chloroflexi bacterium]|nr:hypothetical protein [Chloroflexota bacterium]